MTDSHWMEEALRRWRTERTPEALGELLKSQRDRAYALAVRLGASAEEAEDVVQEACVKLMSREKGFESPADFDCAVYRAVFQCSMDSLRRDKRRARREAQAGREGAPALPAPVATEADMTRSEMSGLRAQVRAAVGELPEETRGPAVLCYYQGLSEEQAARVLEVPRSTLRRRLAQAVGDLRARLGRDGQRLGAGVLIGLMIGEGPLAAPETLCLALDRALPGRPCGEIPALAAPSAAAVPAVPGALGALKLAAAAAGCLAAAGLLALGIRAAVGAGGPGPSAPSQVNQQMDSHPAGAGLRPGDGPEKVMAPVGQKEKEEDEMRGKLSGLTAVVGGLILSGAAGATEPNPEVAVAIAKIQERQAAKAAAAAQDKAEWAELAKKYGGQGQGEGYHRQ